MNNLYFVFFVLLVIAPAVLAGQLASLAFAGIWCRPIAIIAAIGVTLLATLLFLGKTETESD